jgi:hypothetical protein
VFDSTGVARRGARLGSAAASRRDDLHNWAEINLVD